MQKYIEHSYMKRYLDGKIQKNLAEVVQAIDSGEANHLEEKAVRGGIKAREDRHASKLRKKDKKDKKDKKSKKSKSLKKKPKSKSKKNRFSSASSSSSEEKAKPTKKNTKMPMSK